MGGVNGEPGQSHFTQRIINLWNKLMGKVTGAKNVIEIEECMDLLLEVGKSRCGRK